MKKQSVIKSPEECVRLPSPKLLPLSVEPLLKTHRGDGIFVVIGEFVLCPPQLPGLFTVCGGRDSGGAVLGGYCRPDSQAVFIHLSFGLIVCGHSWVRV